MILPTPRDLRESLHSPQTVIDPRNLYTVLPEALAKTWEPGSAGPVNVFLPMNLQSQEYEFNTEMLLRSVRRSAISVRPDKSQVAEAVAEIRKHRRIAIRVGGGAIAALGECGRRARSLHVRGSGHPDHHLALCQRGTAGCLDARRAAESQIRLCAWFPHDHHRGDGRDRGPRGRRRAGSSRRSLYPGRYSVGERAAAGSG